MKSHFPQTMQPADKARGILNLQAGKKFRLNRLLPAEPLRASVEHYWIVAWDLRGQPAFVSETLPHPSVHVVYERGASHIVGVMEGKFSRTLKDNGRVFGIKFRPAGFFPLLGKPVATLTNREWPVAKVLGNAGADFEAQVFATEDDEAQAALANDFLAARLRSPDAEGLHAQRIVADIMEDRTILKVDDVVQRSGMNTRALQRMFQRHIGVSPKWVIQRYRLHEAAEQLAAGAVTAGPDLALSLGYFDQAHFIRDFKAVVGVPPAEYAQRLRQEG
ncbi:MAG TPA: AraC family transcriptional regulator [bacterium]